ncbi:MAG: helix-turn-helix transcriptional regulator [Ruminococcaceae bacterium]|nr:helix-turn-helix transcriptional regulator [Oscillospiraceae bacterium]
MILLRMKRCFTFNAQLCSISFMSLFKKDNEWYNKITKKSSYFRHFILGEYNMSKTIGNMIRQLRCSRNLTQEQLAENLNVTAQAISKWENNIGMPDISQVVPIAHFFGVSTDILFGIEKASAIDEIQNLIDNATAQETYTEEYALLKEALRTYPGDTRLLLELLSCGECLLADGDTVKDSERSIIFKESERAGKLILSYSKDLGVLIEATEWLIKLYCEVGEFEKAMLLSESLPEKTGFNKDAAHARIYERDKKYEHSAKCYSKNISQFQYQLINSIVLCGNMYAQDKEKKKAYELYLLAINISEIFLKNNPVSENKSLQKNLLRSVEKCKKSIEILGK